MMSELHIDASLHDYHFCVAHTQNDGCFEEQNFKKRMCYHAICCADFSWKARNLQFSKQNTNADKGQYEALPGRSLRQMHDTWKVNLSWSRLAYWRMCVGRFMYSDTPQLRLQDT
jgi:hypothetical protein